MADATFSFELEGSGDAALEQAAALEKLREKLVADTAALREMRTAFNALKGSAHANGAAFKGLKDQIAAQKAAIANSHAGFLQLGGDFKKIKKPADDAKIGFEEFLSRVKGSGGPMGKLTGGLQNLQKIGASGVLAAGLVGIGVALVAVATAAAGAIAALFRFGVASADAYRSERLQLEGLMKMPNWYGQAAGKASDLQRSLDQVSASVALGRGELGGMQSSLYQVGFRGAGLARALEGVAIATAAAGEQGGAFAKQMFMAHGHTVAGAKKAGDAIKARFGAIAAAQMLSLGVQSKKLKESFQQLFSGLKIEGLLGGLKTITDLFSQNTTTGRALKTILQTVFQPMVDFATGYGIYFKRFFQGLTFGALVLTLGVLKLRNWLRKTFGDSELFQNLDKQRLAFAAGAALVGAFAVWLGVLAAAVAAVAGPFIYVAYQVAKFIDGVTNANEAIKAVDWSAAGSSMVNGIVNGIKGGAQWVIDAVKNLGTSAVKAFREKLLINSPSKLFARLGLELPRGAAVGARAGTPILNAAVRDMAEASSDQYSAAPALPATTSGSGTSSSRSGLRTFAPVVNLTVNLTGAADDQATTLAEDFRRIVREEVPMILEGIVIQLGARAV